jgi:ketosteroid isomerase-like protein
MTRPFHFVAAISALLISIGSIGHAQSPQATPVDPAVITAINEQVWIPFCESFGANDSETFIALHTDDTVRISMDRNSVKSGATFRKHTASRMLRAKETGRTATLTLRFTQRNHGDDAAFEVGIYKYASEDGNYVGYGKFRVLLRMVDGTWKIALDADQKSDAEAFEAARLLEDTAWE